MKIRLRENFTIEFIISFKFKIAPERFVKSSEFFTIISGNNFSTSGNTACDNKMATAVASNRKY